jgi:hypothetical protein
MTDTHTHGHQIFYCFIVFRDRRVNVLSSSLGWDSCLYDRRVSGARSIPIKAALGGEHSESWAGGRLVQWNVKHHVVRLTVNSLFTTWYMRPLFDKSITTAEFPYLLPSALGLHYKRSKRTVSCSVKRPCVLVAL